MSYTKEEKNKNNKQKNLKIEHSKDIKTSFSYKFISLLFILFICLMQIIAWGSLKSLIENPVMLVCTAYIMYLSCYKITYKDLMLSSKFSLIFVLIIIFSVLLNYYLGRGGPVVGIFYGIAVFFIGILWGINNIQASLYLIRAREKFYDYTLLFVFLYYFIGGISALVISYLAVILQIYNQTFILNLLQSGSVLLAFGAGYLLSLSLVSLLSKFLELKEIYDVKELKIIENDNIRLPIAFKLLSIACSAYLLTILIMAFYQKNILAIYSVPTAIFTFICVYIINLKKYSYEITVILNNSVLKLGGIWLVISLLFYYFIPYSGNNISYDFINNIKIFSFNGLIKYNSSFYISYALLSFSVLGMLLSLNNITNCYNFFIKVQNAGYSVYRMVISLLVLQLIVVYLLNVSVKEATIFQLEYFTALTILTSFVFFVTARFVGYVIYELFQ